MPTIEIQALDTLFFRDGKPFEMGDDNWADGIFPPPPSVIYGALRSAYFTEHPEYIDKINTDEDPTKNLEITGIYLGYKKNDDSQILLPFPKDYFKYEIEGEEKNKRLSVISKENISTNYPLKYIPIAKINENNFADNAETVDGYTNLGDFINKWMEDRDEDLTLIDKENLIKKEPKIGITVNNSIGTAAEGKLYRVGMQRLEKFDDDNQHYQVSLIVSYNLDFIPKLLKLGAENKIVKLRKYDEELLEFSDFQFNNSNFFKIILLTPAIFENGYNPNFKENGINLIAAFVGNPIHIGGWDIQKKEPKKLYRAAPCGSVYWFEADNENIAKSFIQKLANQNSISNYRKNEGFGLFAFGNLKI